MHAESSIIESIRTFFLTCPFLHDGRVNVDYLGEEQKNGKTVYDENDKPF